MSSASVKENLNESASYAESAAYDLKTMAERNAALARSSAEANARDLRAKAEANANTIKSQVDSWKNAAEADVKSFAKSAEKEASWWGNKTEKEAKSWKDAAEKEAKSLKDAAEKKTSWFGSKTEDDAKSLASKAEKEAKSWKDAAEKEAKSLKDAAEKKTSWFGSKAEEDTKSWGAKAEKEAKSWKDAAEKEAKSLKDAAEKKTSWFGSKTEEDAKSWGSKAEKEARAWKDAAEKEAKSWKEAAEKEAKSWTGGAEKDAKSWGKSAEKDAKSWASSVEGQAEAYLNKARSEAESLKNTAESKMKNLSKETQNATASVRASAGNAVQDIKSSVAGTPVDPNAWVPKYAVPDYFRFFAAGALCATITHGAMTPVDVVKTRLQLEPKGSKLNMVSMARGIVASEGPSGLMTGFGPTAVGYLIQGGSKFCGFEFFKAKFATMAGSRDVAEKNRTMIYIGAASAAELIASTLLTPLEAARIRLVSSRSYANGLVGAVTRMGREGGIREFYAAYPAILAKQIPFTQAQFTINEYMHEVFRKQIDAETMKSYGKTGEIGVSLACGLAAGVGAAIASHPADTILSKINKGEGGKGGQISKMIVVAQNTGFAGLWAGLGARIVMQAGLICAQMGLYDQIKISLNAPPAVTIDKKEVSTS